MASAGHVVQATLTMSLLELLSRQVLQEVTRELLADDVWNFLDAPAVPRRNSE